MVLTGSILVDLGGRCALRPGSITVRAGRIASVRFDRARRAGPAGGIGRAVVLPGFIDAHLHVPQFDSIGRSGLTLLDWLSGTIFPAEARWADARYASAMARRVARHLLSFGTTGVVAYATVHREGTLAALRAFGKAGLRGRIGRVLMDGGAPRALTRPASTLVRESAADLSLTAGRMGQIVTPRFALSCSMDLMRGCADLARASGLPVQTHLAEMRPECDLVRRRFGERYVRVYDRAGLLRPGSLLAHGVHLSDADLRLLARRGCVVAHCPTANDFLRSGSMDLARVRRAGVPVALGSDVAGGPDRSMVRVARAMIETAQRLGRQQPTPAEAFWAITAGNADALGWTDAGRIAPGAPADLVIARPDIAWRSAPDPLGALLYGWDDRWIRRVLAAGRAVYDADQRPGR
ncbi:MAG: amidohydrolase family protein [Phycisphaerae bacterium]|nr:amidohydrolase family protein [Phycisphaerae bacterium]